MLKDGDIFPLRVTAVGERRKEVNMISERKVQLEIIYLNTDRENKNPGVEEEVVEGDISVEEGKTSQDSLLQVLGIGIQVV